MGFKQCHLILCLLQYFWISASKTLIGVMVIVRMKLTKQLVQELYNAKKDFLPRNSINSIISSSDDDDDIFKALKVNKERVQDDDEVMLYLQ
ncbi:unnamed protein product [Rhizophagus irregularis]|nr:unnamed protein product [Rhizophagus irregularis]